MLSAGAKLVISSVSCCLSFPERVIGEMERCRHPKAITAKPLGLNYYKISPE